MTLVIKPTIINQSTLLPSMRCNKGIRSTDFRSGVVTKLIRLFSINVKIIIHHLKKSTLIYLFILFIASCTEKQNTSGTAANNNAKTIEALFSETNGEEEFKARCITCHSLRYIEMQPPFPRKTWEKIVDKMVKNFGAPISDSSAKAIVDYLVAIKGKS